MCKRPFPPLAALALATLLVSCASLYRATVTITSVMDSASKEYAKLYVQGFVTPDVATKASLAHANYQKAAGMAHDVLVAAKLDPSVDTKGALEAVRLAASQFIDLIVPLVSKQRTTELRTQLASARSL